MREYPMLQVGSRQPVTTNVFLGLNQNTVVADGEMNDMLNLSGRSYPMLDQRPERKYLAYGTEMVSYDISGICGGESLIRTYGTGVYVNNTQVTGMSVTSPGVGTAEKGKTIIRMGAYALIFPDMKWFNTANPTQYGSLERINNDSGSPYGLGVTGVKFTGEVEGGYAITSPHPVGEGDTTEDPSTGAIMLSVTNSQVETLIWLDGDWRHVNNPGTVISIVASNTEIDSIVTAQAGETIIFDNIRGSAGFISDHPQQALQLAALSGSHMIKKVEVTDNYNNSTTLSKIDIHIEDKAFQGNISSSSNVLYNKIKMYYPTPDFIMSTGNRLWMCRYKDENGQVLNEIRASRLGSIFQWDIFDGLSTDAYALTAGTDGPWTGCAVLKGQPLFFKEHCIHRITGSMPSNYQEIVTMCRGIQAGCWRSAVVVDERLYYKSVTDVMVYDGSVPASVSEGMDFRHHLMARAGENNGILYLCMQNRKRRIHSTYPYELYTYDTRKGLWHRQDDICIQMFARAGENLYSFRKRFDAAAAQGRTNTLTIHGDFRADDVYNAIAPSTDGPRKSDEEPQDWSATFGLFGVDYPDQKYLSRFNIRVQLEQDAWLKMEVQYDEDGNWEDAGTYWGRRMNTIMIPLAPRRCDRFQLRLSGGGGRCRIFSISRQFEGGADG